MGVDLGTRARALGYGSAALRAGAEVFDLSAPALVRPARPRPRQRRDAAAVCHPFGASGGRHCGEGRRGFFPGTAGVLAGPAMSLRVRLKRLIATPLAPGIEITWLPSVPERTTVGSPGFQSRASAESLSTTLETPSEGPPTVWSRPGGSRGHGRVSTLLSVCAGPTARVPTPDGEPPEWRRSLLRPRQPVFPVLDSWFFA